jgi:hypothetical protein
MAMKGPGLFSDIGKKAKGTSSSPFFLITITSFQSD